MGGEVGGIIVVIPVIDSFKNTKFECVSVNCKCRVDLYMTKCLL